MLKGVLFDAYQSDENKGGEIIWKEGPETGGV